MLPQEVLCSAPGAPPQERILQLHPINTRSCSRAEQTPVLSVQTPIMGTFVEKAGSKLTLEMDDKTPLSSISMIEVCTV